MTVLVECGEGDGFEVGVVVERIFCFVSEFNLTDLLVFEELFQELNYVFGNCDVCQVDNILNGFVS